MTSIKLGKVLDLVISGSLKLALNQTMQQINGKSMMKLVKLNELCEKEAKTFDDCRVKMCKEIAEKGEDGEPIMVEIKAQNNGQPLKEYVINDQNKVVLGAWIKEAQEADVEININFKIEEFEKSTLTGDIINMLSPLIVE